MLMRPGGILSGYGLRSGVGAEILFSCESGFFVFVCFFFVHRMLDNL